MKNSVRKIILVIGISIGLCFLVFVRYNVNTSTKKNSSPKPDFINIPSHEKHNVQVNSEDKQHATMTPGSQHEQTSSHIAEPQTRTLDSMAVTHAQPIQNRQVTTLSKDLVVHSSYFDPRPRNGHSNVTILFINVHRRILDPKWILGCGANGIRAKDFYVHSIFENVLMHACCGPNVAVYENVMILCYDLPAPNGTNVFAIYKTSALSKIEMITYSRQPLFHPAPRVPSSKGDEFNVVVCSKIHNKNAPWIREFIQYQKTLGVDHIDFSVLDTFIQDDGYEQKVLNDPIVFSALQEGYINFRVWPETYLKPGEVYWHSENLRKLGCIYRHLGTYDYVMPVDTDDFFNPVTSKKKLKEYIKDYCRGGSIGSCRFEWVRYFPDCGLKANASSDGNVTAQLADYQVGGERLNYKSIHNTKAILDASFHDARCRGCLAPGYRMVSIPRSTAYVAHNRIGLDEYWYKKICLHKS